MFCPHCGEAEQKKETYCRSCGEYLPDMKAKNKHGVPMTPDEQIKMSLIFNLLSAINAFGSGFFLLISHLNRDGTHFSVFIAIAVLFVIGAWQTVSFVNNLKLKERFKKNKDNESKINVKTEKSFNINKTNELLPEADMSNVVPASVTENTTKHLQEKIKDSSKSQQ